METVTEMDRSPTWKGIATWDRMRSMNFQILL